MKTRRRSRGTPAGLYIPVWLAEWAAQAADAKDLDALECDLKKTYPKFNIFLLLKFVGCEQEAAAAILAALDAGLLMVSEGAELTVWDMDKVIAAGDSLAQYD